MSYYKYPISFSLLDPMIDSNTLIFTYIPICIKQIMSNIGKESHRELKKVALDKKEWKNISLCNQSMNEKNTYFLFIKFKLCQ